MSGQTPVARPRMAFLMFALLVLSSFARAQQTQNITVTSTIPQVMNLAVQNTSVSIPFAASDYNDATGVGMKTASAATTVSIASNRAWTLGVRAATSTFSFTSSADDPDPHKSAEDLSIKSSPSSTFISLTTTNTVIASGDSGGSNESGNQFTVDYRMTSNLKSDPPGTYSIGLILTLTSP